MKLAALAGGVPDLAPGVTLRRPRHAERVTDTGLTVIAVRQPGVPLVEMRLRIPFAGSGSAATLATHAARASVLADTLLAGTASSTQVELAERLQRCGADLGVGVDADRLVISGAMLATGMRAVLDVVAEVVTEATYPAHEVTGERDRLAERITVALTDPDVQVREVLDQAMFGSHPYGRELPAIDAVRAVTPRALRGLHERLVRPRGATLVLVGDISPARAIGTVTAALSAWTGDAGSPRVGALPGFEPGRTIVADRPASVQSCIRLGAPALPRHDEGYAALQLANTAYGGYFSSRLVENIREDKGYTYSPYSRIRHAPAGSTLVTQADVATEVTGPSLVEIAYELGRISSLPITEAELEAVRQYAVGTMMLSVGTQAGMASTLSALAGSGLGIDWLREHAARLAAVTLDEVSEQAGTYLAPSRFVAVVLGDAEAIAPAAARLGPVERDVPAALG
ncbi:MAG: M16 family metallopeptidase [Mycobacteriales bacterium]